MHHADIAYIIALRKFKNIKFQKCDKGRKYRYAYHKRPQLSKGVRFVDMKYKCEPVFRVVINHKVNLILKFSWLLQVMLDQLEKHLQKNYKVEPGSGESHSAHANRQGYDSLPNHQKSVSHFAMQ